MTKHEIGETIGFYIFVGLMGWALVSFFPLTWGQALISISLGCLINLLMY